MKFLGFFREPLKLVEVLFLLLITFVIVLDYFFIQQNSNIDVIKNIKIALLIILWFVPIATPFSEKLRNIYIFSIWGLICMFCIVADKSILSFLPMFSLIYSILCRLIYKSVFKVFPVQLWGSWFASDRYSKLEQRLSNKRDLNFSVITFLSGLIIPIIISQLIK